MTDGNENGNSSDEQATPIGGIASSKELHAIHQRISSSIWDVWLKGRLGDQATYTRVSIVSLTHVAAVCAVDVGMSEENFLATCKANYEAALRNAPKWG